MPQNLPPDAMAFADPASASAGQTVVLDAGDSTDPNGDALTFQWTQQAGTSVAISNADSQVASFVAPMLDRDAELVFNVEVSDGKLSDIRTVVVSVASAVPDNQDPTAVISATPESGTAPLMVSFDGSGSSDPDNDSLSFLWSFGDDSPTVTDESPTHTYALAGMYEVTLTVIDSRGGTDTTSTTITVDSAPLMASIRIADDQSLYAGVADAGQIRGPVVTVEPMVTGGSGNFTHQWSVNTSVTAFGTTPAELQAQLKLGENRICLDLQDNTTAETALACVDATVVLPAQDAREPSNGTCDAFATSFCFVDMIPEKPPIPHIAVDPQPDQRIVPLLLGGDELPEPERLFVSNGFLIESDQAVTQVQLRDDGFPGFVEDDMGNEILEEILAYRWSVGSTLDGLDIAPGAIFSMEESPLAPFGDGFFAIALETDNRFGTGIAETLLAINQDLRINFTSYRAEDNARLSFRELLLTPDGSQDFYHGVSAPITELASDPNSALMIAFLGSGNVDVDVAGGQVQFYGQSFDQITVGVSDGTIRFTPPSGFGNPSDLVTHFNGMRIDLLPGGINVDEGGVIFIEQSSDRISVRFSNVQLPIGLGMTVSATCQVELFFDGRIRMSWLALPEIDGFIGLSDGVLPEITRLDDLSAFPLD